MEQLKSMKQTLMGQAQAQMGNLYQVDAKELGEVIDMIKDLEEAIYYCTIVEAMENPKEQQQPKYYYDNRDMDRMYYSSMGGQNGNGNSTSSSGHGASNSYYTEREIPINFRDRREGRSPQQRRMYMEAKELHQDQVKKVKELESYMKELSEDIMEMIEGASPEEKKLLQTKISTLATKIV